MMAGWVPVLENTGSSWPYLLLLGSSVLRQGKEQVVLGKSGTGGE